MSVQAIAWAIQQRAGGPTEKAILMALANYADANGECWPSYKTLADDCEVSRRTVIRVMERLVESGLIEKRPDSRTNGGDTSNIYRIAGCQNVTGGGVTDDTGGVTLVSPRMNLPSNRQVSKRPKPEPVAVPADIAEQIWLLQPITGGKRKATRPDVAEALKAAIGRGATGADILAALTRYYALPDCRKDGGRFASGAVVMLHKDRWRDFLPGPAANDDRPVDPRVLSSRLARYRDTGVWEPGWGPKPTANDAPTPPLNGDRAA